MKSSVNLESGARVSSVAEEFKTVVQPNEARILRTSLCWVPGIVGNKKADTVAKEAVINESSPTLGRAVLHVDMKR